MKLIVDLSILNLDESDSKDLLDSLNKGKEINDNEVLKGMTIEVENIDSDINDFIKEALSMGLDIIITN